MRTTVNRALLASVGVALLGVGFLVLLGGLDLPRRWHISLPSWWPLHDPDQVSLSRANRTRFADQGWWWPTVLAVLGALVLLSLWWLLAQLRERRLRRVDLAGDDPDDTVPGTTWLSGRTLEDAITAETMRLKGVDRVRVTLHGSRSLPRATITVTLSARAEPAALLKELERTPLRHARTSAGLASLPVVVRLRSDRYPASRVE